MRRASSVTRRSWPTALPCACGQRGCVEAYASGQRLHAAGCETALAAGTETRARARDRRATPPRVTAALVARAAVERRCVRARAVGRRASDTWAQAIANYVTLLNPELLVLGGGVMTHRARPWPRSRASVSALTPPCSPAMFASLRAGLGDSVGHLPRPHGDLALALGLAVVTLLSRWPYRARMLYNWDAVQFALALHEFDIAKHQPHPPGYLLYVALGRLLNASLGDPTLAYVALAMLFSAGTTFVALLARARGSTIAPPRSSPRRCSR